MEERQIQRGTARRDGRVLCTLIEITIRRDNRRLGLTQEERRTVSVRFREGLRYPLFDELKQLARRRGAGSRRYAERMAPVTLVYNDGDERIELIGKIYPPDTHHGDLADLEFNMHTLSGQPAAVTSSRLPAPRAALWIQ